ncbi:sugar diacid recognition domain-containing protein [Duganella callida]|uniref:Transcriptional regulator n=1 Tax=Duganella callida TaxID=2561932 RepID=A0A4Y9SB95_9BURK|nr:sugar diacid recognition domain-containing protein [Duganella callida]TFW19368.1 transcriptional regulator [Duganella callida]
MNILSTSLAQDIVSRTMRIIPYNVNVMDVNGSIIASGNPARIGELHAGALLALAKRLTVEIDDAGARHMHGAQPGINLPLAVNGQLCGAVGLSGAPDQVRQFGELVRLTAEMILEQAHLAGELQRDARYREAFVLNLINGDHADRADLSAWARRLDVRFERMHALYLLEPNEQHIDLQRLQSRLQARIPSALTAAAGPQELIILDFYDAPGPGHERQLQALAAVLREECPQPHTLTMGIAGSGMDSVAVSWQSAKAAARVGHARHPRRQLYSYYDHPLPVLLSGLNTGWQAARLRAPVEQLGRHRGMLQRTLETWFAHDGHPAATAAALHIHRNTLDYRLRRIAEITGLDPARLEDRFLLYISVLLSRG